MSWAAAPVCTDMIDERVNATATVNAPVEVVFDVLADPSTHPAIDGTGWVRDSLGGDRLTRTGQIFRMAMYHDNHPDKYYEMANRVEVFDRPRAIAWQPGQGPDERGNLFGSAQLEFGGWSALRPRVGWRRSDPGDADIRLVGSAAGQARHPVPTV